MRVLKAFADLLFPRFREPMGQWRATRELLRKSDNAPLERKAVPRGPEPMIWSGETVRINEDPARLNTRGDMLALLWALMIFNFALSIALGR